MRLKRPHFAPGFFHSEIVSLRVYQQRLTSGGKDLIAGKQQFQGSVRIFAPKIRGAFEIPVGIDEGKFHPALPETSVARANADGWAITRSAIFSRFSSQNSRSNS